jgi:hypothetical protein
MDLKMTKSAAILTSSAPNRPLNSPDSLTVGFGASWFSKPLILLPLFAML